MPFFPTKVALAGLMGTGKTTVGELLAQKLGYSFFDTDAWIEATQRRPVAQIFAQSGEKVFRRYESEAVRQALRRPQTVIALGGGALNDPQNFARLQCGSTLVLLRAPVKTLLQRLSGDETRPLLAGADRETRLRALLEAREPVYARIPFQVDTENSPQEVAQRIFDLLILRRDALQVRLKGQGYPIYFSQQGVGSFADLLGQHCPASQAVLISNATVLKLYRSWVRAFQKRQKLHVIVLPDGERHKTLQSMALIYRRLASCKIDRRTPLIALGGGVIGDMAGFAAATYLRGLPFVQVPTTLLAQVDSSVGGKTGVDLPQGKNLVGAFYQPRFVFIDTSFLATLPRREWISGMAEVIKYAAAFDLALFRRLEREIDRLGDPRCDSWAEIIRRCCALKAQVVRRDEKETKGLRAKLNFGHTLGHAVESLTHYKKFKHGEAVAMGMVFAARKSVSVSGLPIQSAERLEALLLRAGLPVAMPRLGRAALRRALTQDKKRWASKLHFIYLERLGKSVVIPTSLEDILSGV